MLIRLWLILLKIALESTILKTYIFEWFRGRFYSLEREKVLSRKRKSFVSKEHIFYLLFPLAKIQHFLPFCKRFAFLFCDLKNVKEIRFFATPNVTMLQYYNVTWRVFMFLLPPEKENKKSYIIYILYIYI